MTPYNKRINPFVKRIAEDMQLRNVSPNTIDSYTFPESVRKCPHCDHI